jgi:hypothetical protein
MRRGRGMRPPASCRLVWSVEVACGAAPVAAGWTIAVKVEPGGGRMQASAGVPERV